MEDLFAAIDLTTVATAIGAVGVAIIAFRMILKGIDIAKQAIRKA